MKLLYLAPMDVCFHQAKACKTFIRMPWSLYIQCPSDGCIYNTHTSVLASESSLAKLLSQQTCYEMNQILCNELMTLFYAPTSKLTQQRKPRILSASWVQFRCRPVGTAYRLDSIYQYDLSYSLALVNSIPFWLVWAEIEFPLYFACSSIETSLSQSSKANNK